MPEAARPVTGFTRPPSFPVRPAVQATVKEPPLRQSDAVFTPRESMRVLDAYAAQNKPMAEAHVAAAPRFAYGKQEEAPAAPVTPSTPQAVRAEVPEVTVAESIPAEEERGAEVPGASPAEKTPEFTVIGEAFSTYVLVEIEDRLLLIDKHAAHERILFEELLREQRESGSAASQGLLLPLSPRLTVTELAAATDHREDLLAAGFSYTVTAGRVTVDAIPARVAPDAAEALFTEMCTSLAEGAGDPALTEAARRERTLWQVACKAAIKGGRTYDAAHIRWLCERVLATPEITVCPHGRPIAMTMTKTQLDREFNRIQH